MDNRGRVAFATAPPAAMLAFWIGAVILTRVAEDRPLPSGALGHTLFFFMFFGVPLVYAGAGVLGYPAYLALRHAGQLRRGPVVLLAALLGASFALGVLALDGTFGSTLEVGAIAILGAVSGGVGGTVFSLIAFRRSHQVSRPAS